MSKIVVSLVGLPGSGKTTLIDFINKHGYPTIPEDYMEIAGTKYDNRLLMSKWSWINHWFEKVSKYFVDNPDSTFVFTDRSVIEAGMWTKNCYPLFQPLYAGLKELNTLGFTFININIICSKDIIIERINSRLEVETERNNFNERNKNFIDDLFDAYSENSSYWDYHLDSTNDGVEVLFNKLIIYLYEKTKLNDFIINL